MQLSRDDGPCSTATCDSFQVWDHEKLKKSLKHWHFGSISDILWKMIFTITDYVINETFCWLWCSCIWLWCATRRPNLPAAFWTLQKETCRRPETAVHWCQPLAYSCLTAAPPRKAKQLTSAPFNEFIIQNQWWATDREDRGHFYLTCVDTSGPECTHQFLILCVDVRVG